MVRSAALILVGLSTSSALAQSAPPAIGYAKSGSRGDAIYLVEPDGSQLTKIYQGRSSSRFGAPIESIALRMRAEDSGGGGEVAFVEDSRTLKIQRHDAVGQPAGDAYTVAVPAGSFCILHDLDYLANGTLVVADSCSKVWSIAPGSTAASSTAILDGASVNSLTAVDNDILYVDGDQLKRRDSAGGTSTLRALAYPYSFADAGAGKLFLSDVSTFQTVELSAPHAQSAGCTQGGMVEVSPDGDQMVYLYRGMLLLHAADCSGQTPTRVARGIRSVAWRTY